MIENELYLSRHTERPGHSAEIIFFLTKPTEEHAGFYSAKFGTKLAHLFNKMKNDGILKDSFDIKMNEIASFNSSKYSGGFQIYIPSCEETFHNILVSKVEEIAGIVERFASEIIFHLGLVLDAKIIIRENQYESKIVTFTNNGKEN